MGKKQNKPISEYRESTGDHSGHPIAGREEGGTCIPTHFSFTV
jgi:hypothetical protein